MNQEVRAQEVMPTSGETADPTEAKTAETKQLEKKQAHAHSHHVAGTQHAPETAKELEDDVSRRE